MTQHYQYSESPSEPGSILPSQFFDGRKKARSRGAFEAADASGARRRGALLSDGLRYASNLPPAGISGSPAVVVCRQSGWPIFIRKRMLRPRYYSRLSSPDVAQLAGQKAWRHLRPRRPPLSSDLSEADDTLQMGHEVTKNNIEQESRQVSLSREQRWRLATDSRCAQRDSRRNTWIYSHLLICCFSC
jgi:hypothetical protein